VIGLVFGGTADAGYNRQKAQRTMEQQHFSQPRLGNSSDPGNGMPTALPSAASSRYIISPHQPEQSSSMFHHVGNISIHGGNFLQQNTSPWGEPGTVPWQSLTAQ